jgi:hypothetical protein
MYKGIYQLTMEPILGNESSANEQGGCIYCLTHPEQPGRAKIGCSKESNPEIRCSQANRDTWTLPLWKIEFAKKVKDPHYEEKRIHAFLVKDRVHPRREFFITPIEKVKMVFDLIDGEYWDPNALVESGDEDEDDADEAKEADECTDSSDEEEYTKKSRQPNVTKKDMRKYFPVGLRIRHIIEKDKSKVWTGSFNGTHIVLDHNGFAYGSLGAFASGHYEAEEIDRAPGNAWISCQCDLQGNGEWRTAREVLNHLMATAV